MVHVAILLPLVFVCVNQVMEMYADVESRGGILEPPGICEVKFRAADQITKMHEVTDVISATPEYA